MTEFAVKLLSSRLYTLDTEPVAGQYWRLLIDSRRLNLRWTAVIAPPGPPNLLQSQLLAAEAQHQDD